MAVNEQTIDVLNIKINSEAKQSSSGIDKLIASIERLKSVTGGSVGNLSGIAASFAKLNSAISDLKGKSGSVTSIVNSFQKLNSLNVDAVSSKINALSKSLGVLGNMDPSLKAIISDLASISRSDGGNAAMNALKLQAQAAKTQATIDKSALVSAKAQEGLKAIAEKNAKIAEEAQRAARHEKELLNTYHEVNNEVKRVTLENGISIRTSDLGGATPDYEEEPVHFPNKNVSGIRYAFGESINDLKTAISGVGTAAEAATGKVSAGSSRATEFVNRLKQSLSGVKDKFSALDSSSAKFFTLGRLYGWYFILRQIGNTLGGFINNINAYIENINLFDVAMGDAAQSGEKLAQSLQDVLGVDSGEAVRYMGVFKALGSSFGIANKQAAMMSENLTQLGYDLASFYNLSTETAFEKLESVYTGQTRAARSLGIDISNARLQQELYNLGIKENVNDLTQADKAELRYIAIMKQTTAAQGDMARTIQTPANALRVLQAQLAITGRAIGSVFIPALEAILPVVTAVVEIIGDLASELASLVGFTMPKIDYSSLKTVPAIADDAADGIGDIGKNAEKSKEQLNDLIGGFDELNILQSKKNDSIGALSGVGSALSGVGSILNGINLPTYDALSGAVENNITSLKNKIKDFLEAFRNDPLTTFSSALWGVGDAFGGLFGWLSKMDYAGILTGISAAIMAYGITKNPVLAIAIGAVAAALTELFPEKSRIDLLNGSLATLGGALALKAFTGMPFKLALGVSALATSGLIELIGKDNAIDLLATSLAGLGTGIMAFTFTGNLPLALAIGAITTAVSGMAIHFSEFRIAPVLLTGVSSALLAFKFGGFSQGSAGLIGIGTAIASFAELNDIAPELQTALLGLAGAITGVGTAIRLGFGVEGIIIAAVAGALIGLGAGIIQVSEDAKRADLEKRFGSISLSAKEVEDIAKRLTTTDWTVKIDAAITAKEKVAEFEKNLKADIETLNKMNWEVSVGIKLSKDEISTYKQTINNFISDAESYIQQQHYAITLAIDAILEPGSATAKNLTEFTKKYYSDTQSELDKLGIQLSNEVNKAFEDNVLSEGEIIKIQEIQKKMDDLLQKIADQKYQATLESLSLDVKSAGITAESFHNLQTQIQDNIKEQISQAKQSRLTIIQQIDAQYKYNKKNNVVNAEKIREQALQDVQNSFNSKKAILELSGLDISIDTINSKFNSELKSAESVWSSGVKEAMSNGWKIGIDSSKGTYTTSISDLVNSVSGSYQKELNELETSGKISYAARQNIASLVAELQPTETDLKQIAASALAAGNAVPENVAKGISDIEQLKAIGGDIEAINYMVGKKLSTDSTFMNTLATAKDAGKYIDASTAHGIIDNLQLVKDSASGAIIGIKDSVTGKVTEITPTLKQNLSDLGIDMSNSLVKSVKDNTPNVKSAAADMSKGALKGAQEQMKKDQQQWYEWAIWPWNWFKEKNEIHSPSKLFERGGQNIVQGLKNGFISKWDSLKKWWKDNVHFPEIPTPSIKLPHFSLTYEYSGWMADALSWLGMPGLPRINVSWYATGGVFNSPSIIGVGEAGPEAVVPLSENSPWIDKLAESLNEKESNTENGKNDASMYQMMRMAFVSALKEAGGDINVTVNTNLDSEPIARRVYKIQKKDQRRFTTQPT